MKHKLFYIFLFISSIITGQNIISEEIMIKNDSIELPGTLSYAKENSPLIIWIHGSGNVDRNGNQGSIVKANYIQKFRKAVNANDIAFFSYDKRTANPKNFKFLKGIIYEDLANDAKIVVSHFKNDNRFSEIILIGHSQGSLTAMLASEGIDKYISIAGSSTSIDKTIVAQISKQSKPLGESAKAHFKELLETGDIKQVNPFLVSVFAKQNLKFIASWAKYNPSKEIQKIKIPILIINGDKDLQVKMNDAQKLHNANTSSILSIISKMNHVLVEIENDSDNLKSYYSSDFKQSKKLVTTIVNFIKE
jgi:hypothetical protein